MCKQTATISNSRKKCMVNGGISQLNMGRERVGLSDQLSPERSEKEEVRFSVRSDGEGAFQDTKSGEGKRAQHEQRA